MPQSVDAAARLATDITPGKLTPPESSVPVALEVPERGGDESAFGYYFKVGKGYVRTLFLVFPRVLVAPGCPLKVVVGLINFVIVGFSSFLCCSDLT